MDFKLALFLFASAILCVNVSAQQSCTCPRQYSPICGSDGVTYNNQCLLNCARFKNLPVTVAKPGPCEGTTPGNQPPQPGCVCPALYSPVCGSDGVTYSNDCTLNCATASNHLLRIAHGGPCRTRT